MLTLKTILFLIPEPILSPCEEKRMGIIKMGLWRGNLTLQLFPQKQQSHLLKQNACDPKRTINRVKDEITLFFFCGQLTLLWMVTPWTAAHQASLSFIISRSLLKLMSIDLVMLSNHLILCHPLLLLLVFPSISLFQWASSSHQEATVLELQHQSFQRIFRVDFL